MNSIQYSPTELLLEIFKYLPRSSLLNCATVCRTWQAPAIIIFYESVELSEKTKPIWLHIVNEETPCTKNVGVFVKKLTVSLTFSTTITQADFLKVLSYLPFVKSIDLNLSGYKLHYLAYLNKRGQDCVTYLEDIDAGDLFTDYQMQQYFLCAYSFRHSLKHLTLRNPYSSYIIGQDQQPTIVLSLIKDFESLSHLSVVSDAPADNNELLLLMNSFRGCSTLTHLTYRSSYFQTHYPPNYEEFDQLHKALNSQPLQSKLQTVELHLPTITEHCIRNILCTFPLYLNTLSIVLTHTDYTTWIQSCNELFGMYLGYVKNLKVSISNCNRRGYRNRKRETLSLEELSKYWQFIRSIIRGRQVFFQVKFTAYKSGSRPDLLIERDDRHLLLSYNSDEFQDLHMFMEELSLMCHDTQMPLLDTFQQAPKFNNYSDVHFDSLIVEIPSMDIISLKKQFEAVGSMVSSGCATNTLQSILVLLPVLSIEKEEKAGGNSFIDIGLCSSLPDCIPSQYHHNQRFLPLEFHDSTYTAVLKNIDFNKIPLDEITKSFLASIRSLKIIGCKNFTQTLSNSYTINLGDVQRLNLLVLDLNFLMCDSEGEARKMTGKQVLVKLGMLSTHQDAYYKLYIDSSVCCITETNTDNVDYASFLSIQCQSVRKIIGYYMNESFVIDTTFLTK